MKSYNSHLGIVFDSSECQRIFEENGLNYDEEKTEYYERSEWEGYGIGWGVRRGIGARVFFRDGLEVARYSFLTRQTVILHEPRKNALAE